MISQKKTKEKLNSGKLNFVILVGERGSGKKTLLRETYGDKAYWLPNNSVEAVREMNKEANRRHDTVFIIPDADSMSLSAKNSLLKTVEECKNGNSFIMTVTDEYNVLETLTSRAHIVYLEPYTPEQLFEYFWEKFPNGNPNDAELVKICATPGEVNTFVAIGGRNFYDYIYKVADFIDKASIANVLKIGNEIAFKDEANKYDLLMFWKTFVYVCEERLGEDEKYRNWIKITSEALRQLRITGVNKQALFTLWILNIRGE